MLDTSCLPSFDDWVDRIAAAERGDGWLSVCDEGGQFLAPSVELVEALAALLQDLSGGRPALEVCAGCGALAAALTAAGVPLRAVDAAPPPGTAVERATAQEALARYRPAVVLGAFVPIDAGVDEAVLACRDVQHYVVLGARIGGLFGSPALERSPAWRAEPLESLSRWMLTRHDVWLGPDAQRIIQRGEAWHLRRVE